MREKDQQKSDKATNDASKDADNHLSDSISNAHASGDGAIERGKDNLMTSDDAKATEEIKPGENESY